MSEETLREKLIFDTCCPCCQHNAKNFKEFIKRIKELDVTPNLDEFYTIPSKDFNKLLGDLK